MAEVFGRRLRDLRVSAGYSRRELAEGAGLSESAVRDYEQLKRQPSLEAAARIAVALGKSLAVWDHCLGMTTGAYRLKPRGESSGVLTFGQYKGCELAEVPTDYLTWLVREAPASLKPGQLEGARRLLGVRSRDRRVGAAEERVARQEAVIAADQARRRARQGRQTLEEELAATQAKCRELEERQKRLRETVLQREEAPKPAAKPPMDDALPWEKPPPEPPPEK